MKKGGKGGANTRTGLEFEDKVDLIKKFEKINGYSVKENVYRKKDWHAVYFQGELVAYCIKKHGLYRFLSHEGVDWKQYLTTRLLPDNALVVFANKTLFIIEVKMQRGSGSVDEKLQTCNFKKRQYTKLADPLNLNLEYVYLLAEWFKQERYRDVLDYIEDVGCHYFFDELPLEEVGLPTEDYSDE